MTLIQRILIAAVLIPAALFLGDYATFRVRGNPRGSVLVKQYYAIPIKGNKVQYLPAESANEECVNTLLPQGGEPPCWYLRRHTRRQIDM